MSQLMVTISGVRGIIGETLTPNQIIKYVAAFALLQQGSKIILGRDSRVSGPWIKKIVHGVLISMGYEVIELGIVPTPTVQLLVEKLHADGGLVITSSHNPIEWNGLKFIDTNGCFLSPEKCEKMFHLADEENFLFAKFNDLGKLVKIKDGIQQHITSILSLPFIDIENIRSKQFKVALDTVNGAGGIAMTELLQQLGCEVLGMNIEPTGIFAHPPEPIPCNLSDLSCYVVSTGSHLGIAVDPDVDRCVLIDETGKPIGEEYTLGLAVEMMLGIIGRRGAVVKNLSSSRVTDDIALKYKCPVFATPVGEIHVAVKMIQERAVIGGEGNGGVMLPDVHIGRDALVAATLTLCHLAYHINRGGEKSLSSLKATLPQYEIVKLKAPTSGIDVDAALAHLKSEYSNKDGVSIIESDGLRIDFHHSDDKKKEGEGKWVHLRKSNTEPIVRVIGEARTEELATTLCQSFLDQLQTFESS